MEIRSYHKTDEKNWVRCRTLAFLDTAYFDNVLREKEQYENSSIELVAIQNGIVAGLLDIEYETEPGSVCTGKSGLGGMIWHMAVHPDFQRHGIGEKLLAEAEIKARGKGLAYLEAWTRDDEWVNNWYEKHRFQQTSDYLHVYLQGRDHVQINAEKTFIPVQTFAHYTGDDKEWVKEHFDRVHECRCYQKTL